MSFQQRDQSPPLNTALGNANASHGPTWPHFAYSIFAANNGRGYSLMYQFAFRTSQYVHKTQSTHRVQTPYTSRVVARVARATSSIGRSRYWARESKVYGIIYGAFVRPRYGIGVRYGASVSTITWSSPTMRADSRMPSLPL